MNAISDAPVPRMALRLTSAALGQQRLARGPGFLQGYGVGEVNLLTAISSWICWRCPQVRRASRLPSHGL